MFSVRGSGLALIAGGALTFLANALTPLLGPGNDFAATAAAPVFLWRQGLSALAALALLVGSIGLYVVAARRASRLEVWGCRLAFLGSALLLAHEWSQVAVVHPLARLAPAGLAALEAAPGVSAFDVAAMVALTTFALGWLAVGVALLRARRYPRRGPITLIAGFFAIPLLSAAIGPAWGSVLGAAVLAAGWIMLGGQLRGRQADRAADDAPLSAHGA